jgi:hypothetical protein
MGAEICGGVIISRNSFTTHSEIQGHESGLTTPVVEHFASYGQVMHGASSIERICTGILKGVNL